MKWKRALLWLRNDLRLHDHEALVRACEQVGEVIPVYCLDPRHFGELPGGMPKTGYIRTRFLLESLQVLRSRLQEKGSNLLVVRGRPETILPELAKSWGAEGVFAHRETTDEEVQVQAAVEDALFKGGITLELFWGSTLYHLQDLPMPLHALPDIFTQFRKQVEKLAPVREPFATPDRIETPEINDPGLIPHIADMGLKPPPRGPRGVLPFNGGEVEALDRLQSYFWEGDHLKQYKETRNGLLGADYSSKFSPWLALGCISPRLIYAEVRRYERMRTKNSSTYWMIFELIWRDYFRFVAKKVGNRLFYKGGIKGQVPRIVPHEDRFQRWVEGETGIPFIDANMKELYHTGFMSNRGRQNVASFLVHDLHIDWRWGARYFESQLIDYDPCSNWGNWNYVAGIGNDPRENRYFNVISQAKRYDPKGDYVRYWLSNLEHLPNGMVHTPYEMPPGELRPYGVQLGGNYPHPIVNFRARSRSR
ncbi:MAG: DASH family cryptochrome [Bacteroidota bacterium]